MTWEINIPFRDREDLVLEAIRAARDSDLPEQEVQVVDVLARDALERGIPTVGGLLDELDGLDRDGQRARLDWAREKAGLVSATESDRRRDDAKFEGAWQALRPPPPPEWSAMQHCPECGAYPTESSGAWAPVSVQKWWCETHRDRAAEGDMDEYEPPIIGFGLNGRPIYSEKEKARLKAWHEAREAEEARERELREEHDRREREALDAVSERYEREETISVAGVQLHPANLRINP